jgi:spermidine/putrescine transport system permease protein
MPKFGLAIPSWVWYLGFFVVPRDGHRLVQLRLQAARQRGQGPIGTDHLSLQNYRDALSDTFFKTFQNTFRVAVIGRACACWIGLPVAYFIAVKVPAKWAWPHARARDRALLTSFLIRTIAWRIVLAPRVLLELAAVGRAA